MADPVAHLDSNGDTGEGAGVDPGSGSVTGTPRWVKVAWVIGVVLVLLLVVMLVSGHGPSRHMHGEGGHHTPVSSITVLGGQPA